MFDKTDSAARLLACFGEISDSFLEEVESSDTISMILTQRKLARYGKLAAAASFGLAVTYWLFRSKKGSASVKNLLKKSA